MARKVLAVLAVVTLTAVSAYAQERVGGAGRFEIGAFPGGGMFSLNPATGTSRNLATMPSADRSRST